MEGLAFGRFRVTRRLGAGGMAEVYVAKHELMDRYAAVKLLLPEMSAREDIVKRFFQEAQAAACIEHPGIVHVYDVGYTEQGRAYLVMELLSGETLNQRLKRQQRMSIDAAVTVIRQLAGIMEAAHQSGIIHRDLKPDNIFLVPDPEMPTGERVKVLDFGLAKLVEAAAPAIELTAQGAVFGTPAYMAPEQCKSAASVDGRADIYAIGCLFYACLCGKPPFGTGGIEVLLAHMGTKPVPPRQLVASIPPPIEALIMRLLEKDPARRLQSCEALVAELDLAVAAAARLARDMHRRQSVVNDEATIREDATLQGTVALLGEFERAGSQDGVIESVPDTYETSAAPPPPLGRNAHLIDTQRIPAQGRASSTRASTDGESAKETRPMRKASELPIAATRRLQTSEPMPLPGVTPMQRPSTRPLPGVPPAHASGPAHQPGVNPARSSGPVRQPGVNPAQSSGPVRQPGVNPAQSSGPVHQPGVSLVQSSGPARQPALTPMHARALRPVDMSWPAAGAPGEAGQQPRAGTDDDMHGSRGSTPTISNGEIETHRRKALARDRKRAHGRRMLWMMAGASVLAGLVATGFLLGTSDQSEAEPTFAISGSGDDLTLGDLDNGVEKAPPVETDPNLVKIDALLSQAEQDMAKLDWESAGDLLQRADKHEGIDEKREKRVLEMATRVAAEKQSRAAVERMRDLDGVRKTDKLVAEFGKIPEDSVYRAEAQRLYEAASTVWLESMGERVKRLVREGDCQAVAGIVKNAARMFPDAETNFAAQSTTCKPAEDSEKTDDASKLTAKQLSAQVKANLQGRTALAFDLCHQGWKVVAGDEELTTLCGLAACKTKNESAARQYYKKAPPDKRGAIAQTCLREGINVQDKAAAPAVRSVSPARAQRGVAP